MNKVFSLIAFLIILFFTYGFYLSQFQLEYVATPNNLKTNFFDYRLNQNVHSNFSLGSGAIPEIVEEVKKIQNNFVVITDLDQKVDLDQDKYLDQVGVLTATKFVNEFGRFILYNSNTKGTQFLNNEFRDFLSGQKPSSLLVWTHPLNSNFSPTLLNQLHPDGIEVINLKRMTQRAWDTHIVSTIWSLMFYPFNPKLSLIRLFNEPSDELSVFDEISQSKSLAMFLGSEASARAIPFADWLIKFPSYERTLGIASQHLLLTSELTGDMSHDAPIIQSALKQGRFFLGFDVLGSPIGFEAYIKSETSDRIYQMGEVVKFQSNLKLYFQFPEPNVFYEIILFQNGKRIDHFNTFSGFFQIREPGTYRLQVRISAKLPLPDATKWIGWIYSNNFYVN